MENINKNQENMEQENATQVQDQPKQGLISRGAGYVRRNGKTILKDIGIGLLGAVGGGIAVWKIFGGKADNEYEEYEPYDSESDENDSDDEDFE